jgi:hypothetical protein
MPFETNFTSIDTEPSVIENDRTVLFADTELS